MRAINFLQDNLASSLSIEKDGQYPYRIPSRNIRHPEHAITVLWNSTERAHHTLSNRVSLNCFRLVHRCLDPCSIDSAFDQHFIGMSRKYQAMGCHLSRPKEHQLQVAGT
jgi:hypothetical protein